MSHLQIQLQNSFLHYREKENKYICWKDSIWRHLIWDIVTWRIVKIYFTLLRHTCSKITCINKSPINAFLLNGEVFLTSSGLELDLFCALDLSYIFEVCLPHPMGYPVSLLKSHHKCISILHIHKCANEIGSHGRWEMNLQNKTQI